MIANFFHSRLLVSTFVFAATVAIIAAVWAFERIGGYIPCALCLEQRVPYYWAIPVAAAAALVATTGRVDWLVRGALAVVGLLAAYSAALGFYHAGVEWAWWQGPAGCAAVGGGDHAAPLSAQNLAEQMAQVRPPSCDEAAGRFLGLSFAGWNVLAGAAIATVALAGAATRAHLAVRR